MTTTQTPTADASTTDAGHRITEAGMTNADHGPPEPGRIMELGLAFWGSKTLLSAIELGLFSELAAGPRDGADLTARLGLHARSAGDFFDALVALGMLTRDVDIYANTVETDLFLDRAKPSYVGGMLEMANARLYPFWGSLTDALRTGAPQNEVRTGGDFFAALYSDPDRLAQFLHAMTALSTGAAMAIAQKFPFDRYRTVADLGCAEGGVLAQLVGAHDHLTGVGFDLPACREAFSTGTPARAVWAIGWPSRAAISSPIRCRGRTSSSSGTSSTTGTSPKSASYSPGSTRGCRPEAR